LNCTGAQQAKLIDFLQSRVEELEPLDKKKKKVSLLLSVLLSHVFFILFLPCFHASNRELRFNFCFSNRYEKSFVAFFRDATGSLCVKIK